MIKKNLKILKKETIKIEVKKVLQKTNPFDNKILKENDIEEKSTKNESLDLENLVNISTPKYPILNPTKISPMLEISQESLETNLSNIPTLNQTTENTTEFNNTPKYTQGSSSLYENSGNYNSNSGNYDNTSNYPKMISALNANKSPSISLTNSNPSLSLKSSNTLASNESPQIIQDESKKYEPISGQKPNRRRF